MRLRITTTVYTLIISISIGPSTHILLFVRVFIGKITQVELLTRWIHTFENLKDITKLLNSDALYLEITSDPIS